MLKRLIPPVWANTSLRTEPMSKYLFKVSKITLEQRPDGRCSNVILLIYNRYLPTGEAPSKSFNMIFKETKIVVAFRPMHLFVFLESSH